MSIVPLPHLHIPPSLPWHLETKDFVFHQTRLFSTAHLQPGAHPPIGFSCPGGLYHHLLNEGLSIVVPR